MSGFEFREPLLRTGFERFTGEFASGVTANNKLMLGYNDLESDQELRWRVVNVLADMVRQFQADLLVPVPTGADGYAKDIALARGIVYAKLRKDEVTRVPSHTRRSERMVHDSQRIVIIEDVPNELTSIRRVLALPGISERTVGIVGIWDRGDPSIRQKPAVPLDTIVREPIPVVLPNDSEYWQYTAA